MIRFQLDECLNSRKLYEECNATGKSEVKRFPSTLRGKGVKDPAVLSTFVPIITLVTSDMAIVSEHSADIPPVSKGLVVLGSSPEILKTATDNTYREIIATFKAACPNWAACDFSNSIVIITEQSAQVFHIDEGRTLHPDGFFQFSVQNWADDFVEALKVNASRGNLSFPS